MLGLDCPKHYLRRETVLPREPVAEDGPNESEPAEDETIA
jgi:hypothetical protein